MRSLTYVNPNGQTVAFSATPYMIESLSGVDSPVLFVQEKRAPNQDGATHIDALYDGRDITIEGAIASAPGDLSAIATARRAIITALNPKEGPGTLTYVWDGGSFRITAIPVTAPVFKSRNATEPYQRFQIVFHAADPYWQAITEESESLSYLGASLEFPVEIPPGGVALSELGGIKGQTKTLQNDGDVECPVTVRFYGPALNPKIINNATGEYIRLVKTIASGDYIEVATAFGAKTVLISESGAVTNAMMYLDLASTFFQLIPGSNQIEFQEDGASDGSSATITYRERYIGA